MANFLYKILNMFSLTDDYDDDDEDFDDEDDFDDEEEDESPRFKVKKSKEKPVKEKEYTPEPRVEKKNNVLPYSRKSNKNTGMAVCVIKPTSLEDGREISDMLTSGKAVVLNLEDVDGDMAQRIIDFSSGACYSMGGNLQKVSTYIFVVTPSSVDIAGDFQDYITSAATSSSSMSMGNMGMATSPSFSTQNKYRF